MLANDFLNMITENSPLAYSLYRVIRDENNKVSDFMLVDINPAFEKNLGLLKADIHGKKMSEWLLAQNQDIAFWLDAFTEIVEGGGRREFDNIFELNDNWLLVTAYTPEKDYLIVLFHNDVRFKKAVTETEMERRSLIQALKASDARSSNLFLNAPMAIIFYEVIGNGESGHDYIIRDVNPKCLEMQGWVFEEVFGKSLADLYPYIDSTNIPSYFNSAFKRNKPRSFTAEWYENGQVNWYDNFVFRLPPNTVVSMFTDVTAKKQAEDMLFSEKEKLAVTLYSIGDAIIVTDENGNINMMNPIAEKLTGWKQDQAQGLPLSVVFDIYSEKTGKPYKNPAEAALEEGKTVGFANHIMLRSINGRSTPIDNSASPIKSRNGKILGVVLVFRDITEVKRKQDQIEYLSYRDSLTRLYNRNYFKKEYEHITSEACLPLTIIMGDLSGLKLINDAFGHNMGDKALLTVSEILLSNTRKTDIVCRWGGDEFLIILPNTDTETGRKIRDALKQACDEATIGDIGINVSFGRECIFDHRTTFDIALKTAEDKMYRNKLLNSNSYRNNTLNLIKTALFEKSHETEAHGKRIGELCKKMGLKLGLSSSDIDNLEIFALLHDIGKSAIDNSILEKSEPLTDEEWKIMQNHPEIGYRIARGIPALSNISELILSHHEHWDGNGYPRGLVGENIPLPARILAVVDAFDSMTHDRVYRKGISKEEAFEELQRNGGTQFDPECVEIFLSLF